ncbi:hypothetical protein BDZ94DRAFT_1304951 [Collybia nuda]|uniref:Uncharacterized protein n=1 Tax=Collybia nuda TaxID=64659 RepID=A0A9P5YF50_9AGAR|nr:hypothetical protein BDZ94DRAFT_1304951 [Collybia nuda]
MTRRHSFIKPKVDVLALSRQALTTKMEVDILIGLRIVEHLGRDQPTKNSTNHPKEDEILQILNWISLCIVSDSPSPYCDVAVAISAQPGNVTIHISSGSGSPSQHEHENIALFIDTLRCAFLNDLGPSLIVRDFLGMLAHRALPQIIQKIRAVQKVEGGGPEYTYKRFYSLVCAWLHHRPEGEISKGFVDLAVELTRREDQATNVMVQSFFDLLSYNIEDTQRTTPQEKYQHMVSAMASCDLLVSSTFFDDVINRDKPYRLSLEITDLLFLHELIRRLSQIACYQSGLEEFVDRGVPYLKHVLGCDGMENFKQGTGGIIVNWINTHVPQNTIKTRYWPISPSDKIGQVLATENLEVDHLNPEMREYICQTEVVTGAWMQGEAITPKVHCELQLLLYLEERFIDVNGDAIGTSAPMCWACHCYIKKRNSRKWRISQTSGKARDDWCLPPGRPDLGAAVLRSLNKKVGRVVEEYACECFP